LSSSVTKATARQLKGIGHERLRLRRSDTFEQLLKGRPAVTGNLKFVIGQARARPAVLNLTQFFQNRWQPNRQQAHDLLGRNQLTRLQRSRQKLHQARVGFRRQVRGGFGQPLPHLLRCQPGGFVEPVRRCRMLPGLFDDLTNERCPAAGGRHVSPQNATQVQRVQGFGQTAQLTFRQFEHRVKSNLSQMLRPPATIRHYGASNL
jgi:hypothetical protein